MPAEPMPDERTRTFHEVIVDVIAVAADCDRSAIDRTDGSYGAVANILADWEHDGWRVLSGLLGIAEDSDDGHIAQRIADLRAEVDRLTGVVRDLTAERDGLRALWPKNGMDEDTDVRQLISNHRAWTAAARAELAALRERVGNVAQNLTDCLPLQPKHQESLAEALRLLATEAGPSDVPPESGGHCPDRVACTRDCDPTGQCARVLHVRYRNWQGRVAERRFIPQGKPYEGASQWHPEVQPLMDVVDVDSGERRTIALRGVERWGPAPVDPLAHVKVGDPVPEPDVDDTCDELGVIADEDLTVTCTRQAGHPGQHIACGDEVLAVWPATSDAVTTEEATS